MIMTNFNRSRYDSQNEPMKLFGDYNIVWRRIFVSNLTWEMQSNLMMRD